MRPNRVMSAIVAVVFILLVGAVAVVAAFGGRLLAVAIEKVGPALLGREVQVGSVAIDWGRHTAIRMTDLTLANANWSAGATMFSTRQAELTLDWLDLLRLRLLPVALVLRQPKLHLARNAEGRWNLPGAKGGAGSSNGVRSMLATLRQMEIEGGEINLDDLTSSGLEARIASLSARLSPAAERMEFRGTVTHDGVTPIAFAGRTGSPAALLGNDNGPFPVQMTLGPEAARLSVEGRIARPLDLAGVDLRLRAQGGDLAPLLAAFAGGATHTPPFDLMAQLTDTARGWRFENLVAHIGESELHGEAALSMRGQQRPQLSMNFVAPQLIPSDFRWLASLGWEGEDASASVADAELPTAWLTRADAQGSLRVERLVGLASGPAGLQLDFNLKEGRLQLEPLRLELEGGVSEGSMIVEAGDSGAPRIVLRAEANGMQLAPLLAMFGTDALTARLETASVDLRGEGMTLREVAAGLNGTSRFRLEDGRVGVASLAHMSMGLVETLGVALSNSRNGSTPLTCAIGNFAVRNGVAHAERLIMVIPQIVIVGEGSVRLDDATLNLTLTPKPIDEALLRVIVPVVISGPLAEPEVSKQPELRIGARSAIPPDPCGHGSDRR